MMVSLIAAMALQQAAAPSATSYPSDMQRAEICYAHVMLLIIEAAKDGGRVAGPSWFVRDWWNEKLNPAQLKDQRLAAVQAAVERRRLEDAEFFAAERRTCIQDAIDGGALPS